jgi:hypothetical protein
MLGFAFLFQDFFDDGGILIGFLWLFADIWIVVLIDFKLYLCREILAVVLIILVTCF